MIRVNRNYLDYALNSVNQHTDSLLEKSNADRVAIRAAAQALSNKTKSDLAFRTNVSRGILIALILVGSGIFCALAIKPLSQMFNVQNPTVSTRFLESGALQPNPTAGVAESSITQSVTLFNNTSSNDANTRFRTIVAGHVFNSVNDENWSNAYCYTSLMDNNDTIRIDLSRVDGPSGQIDLLNYVPNERFSRNEFVRAQERCAYQHEDF